MMQYNRNYIENRATSREIIKQKLVFSYNKLFILIVFIVLLYLMS